MKLSLVDQIATAVLYEGYLLYPYRASAVKNRQRFNFGVLVLGFVMFFWVLLCMLAELPGLPRYLRISSM